jgi:hypothetical protein
MFIMVRSLFDHEYSRNPTVEETSSEILLPSELDASSELDANPDFKLWSA